MADVKHFDPDATLETVLRLFWQRGAASTGVQDIVTATGVNRSSLYATFGDKQALYRAALNRYTDLHSRPAFRHLAEDGRGLPAVVAFFDSLIEVRCSGPYARWGCLVVNAHAGAENGDPEVRALLDAHHEWLREALHTALLGAAERGQLAPGVDPASAAGVLALLAYGVNLRSRAGADATDLTDSVRAALAPLAAPTACS
ncbi:TetR/AcrR family transcriptional regulator [Streptomyces sp. SKN60]|uniref:TetR/AcrR family transcriptional regulator n=1 Tax=Streptomyces sp. SKN60 TaxID=2855506 RepID=UPI002246B735|nr:TetR/AcrR family transcriptional regulator [Streptomyces sp. SKN60]MCX2181259.1 TetR/AcrR family transcriptional regulator [Streptomyces sp. SKN60]